MASFRNSLFASLIIAASCLSLLAARKRLFQRAPYADRLTALREDQIDIGLVALHLAKELNPNLNVETYSRKIDDLVRRARLAVGDADDSETRRRAINSVLYDQEGYRYDEKVDGPDDFPSALDELPRLLDTKRGTCLTLAVLYLAVAQRLGYPIYPVSAPGHDFLRYVDSASKTYNIEPTAKGVSYPDSVYIQSFALNRKSMDSGAYLRTLSYREFLAILLNDSAIAYKKKGLPEKTVAYGEKAVQLDPLCAPCHKILAQGHMLMSVLSEKTEAERHFESTLACEKTAADLGWIDPEETPLWKIAWKK